MYLLSQRLLYGAVSPVGREHESKDEKIEAKVGHLPSFPINDPLGDSVLHVSATQREHILARRHSKDPSCQEDTLKSCVLGPVGRKKSQHIGTDN